MSDEHSASNANDVRTVAVAFGVVVACLAYAGSLALQVRFPAVRQFLALDLGPGGHPTYYLRVGLSLGAGIAAAALATGVRRQWVGEEGAAWAAGVLVAAAAIVAVLYP